MLTGSAASVDIIAEVKIPKGTSSKEPNRENEEVKQEVPKQPDKSGCWRELCETAGLLAVRLLTGCYVMCCCTC